jgi:hypothetical protein
VSLRIFLIHDANIITASSSQGFREVLMNPQKQKVRNTWALTRWRPTHLLDLVLRITIR